VKAHVLRFQSHNDQSLHHAGGDVAGAVGFDLDLDIAVVDFADPFSPF
jgi:hypothetical protein